MYEKKREKNIRKNIIWHSAKLKKQQKRKKNKLCEVMMSMALRWIIFYGTSPLKILKRQHLKIFWFVVYSKFKSFYLYSFTYPFSMMVLYFFTFSFLRSRWNEMENKNIPKTNVIKFTNIDFTFFKFFI